MKRSDFRLVHRLRVRWAEVDMQKIVFNAHYLMYFDTAIADYWRALALPYEEAMLQLGGELYVKKTTVEYHASARLDDRLEVAVRCVRIGNSSMKFTGAIFCAEAVLTTCELVYVFADPEFQTSLPVPLVLRSLVGCFEAGESVVSTSAGDWAALGAQAAKTRTAATFQMQGIPPRQERDQADDSALFVVVFNALGQGIATGRMVCLDDRTAKIDRLAVHRALRGVQIGQGLLETLIHEARQWGCTKAILAAESSAVDFFRRLGFTAHGESFEAEGTSQTEMTISF